MTKPSNLKSTDQEDSNAALAFIDGSGNSARIQACACAIYIGDLCYTCTKILPGHTTNNVGEYNGLLLAVRFAKLLGVMRLDVRSDSRLIVEQTLGFFDVRNPKLRTYRDQIWELAQSFDQVTIRWIPREENMKADGLCRQAIKEALERAK